MPLVGAGRAEGLSPLIQGSGMVVVFLVVSESLAPPLVELLVPVPVDPLAPGFKATLEPFLSPEVVPEWCRSYR